MACFTPSLLSVSDLSNLLTETLKRKGSTIVLMIGPREACVAICSAMLEAHEMEKNQLTRPLFIIHIESARALPEQARHLYYNFIVVVVQEGGEAMKDAENEIRTIDPRFLVQPSVEVVNWRTDSSTSNNLVTRPNEIIKFCSRFHVHVRSVFGHRQNSVSYLGTTLFNRLQQVVSHPHVPA